MCIKTPPLRVSSVWAAERKSCAFPLRSTKDPRRRSRQVHAIPITAKPSFAARRNSLVQVPVSPIASSAYRIHIISLCTLHVDSNAKERKGHRKDAKAFHKVHKDTTARFFPFAYFAGLTSRTLRLLRPRTHCLVFLLSALVSTQRTRRYSQRSQRRRRGNVLHQTRWDAVAP